MRKKGGRGKEVGEKRREGNEVGEKRRERGK